MATLALRIVGPRVGDFEYRIDIADTDAARILTAYGNIYGPVRVVAENGDETIRPRTPNEIVEEIAKGFQEGTFANVIRWEKEQAARNAADGVLPIDPLGALPVVNGVDPDGNVVNDVAAKVAEEQAAAENTGYFSNLWNAIKGA